MSGDSTKGPCTTMAKRGVFFQLYLNPQRERDRKILAWIEGIPKWRRSGKVKDLLYGALSGDLRLRPEIPGISQKTAEMTRNLFRSIKEKPSTEG